MCVCIVYVCDGLSMSIPLQSHPISSHAHSVVESVSMIHDIPGAFTVVGLVWIDHQRMPDRSNTKMAVDTGMVVVIFISLMYMVLVFGLLFYVKNDWCDLLFKNMTVISIQIFPSLNHFP